MEYLVPDPQASDVFHSSSGGGTEVFNETGPKHRLAITRFPISTVKLEKHSADIILDLFVLQLLRHWGFDILEDLDIIGHREVDSVFLQHPH